MAVTLEIIAKNLGLSKSTVSRAISGKGRISKATIEKVRNYAKEIGYESPNTIIDEKNRSSIAVIMPADAYSAHVPFFQECILGVSETSALLGVNVIILNGNHIDTKKVLEMIEDQVFEGIIFLRAPTDEKFFEELIAIHFPVALVGYSPMKKLIQINTNNHNSARELSTVLVQQGYRHFLSIFGNMDFEVNQERRLGHMHALEDFGLDVNKNYLVTNIINNKLIDNVLENYLNLNIDCILCGDDVICSRVISKLQSDGKHIPRDIAVASLENSVILDSLFPPVTTVNIPVKQIGTLVSQQLIQKIRNEEYQEHIKIDHEIFVRKSTIRSF